eukprot:5412179-Pleurochrysis_carterae.AAC.1
MRVWRFWGGSAQVNLQGVLSGERLAEAICARAVQWRVYAAYCTTYIEAQAFGAAMAGRTRRQGGS